jgi:hypothetical protein
MNSARVAILVQGISTGRIAPNIIHSLESWLGVRQYATPANRVLLPTDDILRLSELLLARYPKQPALAMMLVSDALRIAEQYTDAETAELSNKIEDMYYERQNSSKQITY